ncbi:MAG: hypothetical protein ACI85O_001605 [Saprospiraceae bacterium]|jgi:hypothetical protein
MKRYKIFITIDLLVQSILLLLIIICAFMPLGLFKSMVFFAIIGGWQVISSIVWVWPFKDKKRYPYLIIVTLFYGIGLPIIVTYYPDLMEKIGIIFNIFNPFLIGIWY